MVIASIIPGVRVFALMRIAGDTRLSTVLTARAIVQNEHADACIVGVARIRARNRSPFLVVAQLPFRPQALVALILGLGELVIPLRTIDHVSVSLCESIASAMA